MAPTDSKLRAWMHQDLKHERLDLCLLCLAFASAIVDTMSVPVIGVFVSNSTGETASHPAPDGADTVTDSLRSQATCSFSRSLLPDLKDSTLKSSGLRMLRLRSLRAGSAPSVPASAAGGSAF